jgi:hypothetical protein
LTYTRKITRGKNIYLYRVKSFRDRETGEMRQRAECLGNGVLKDNVKTIQKLRNRITVRKVLESAPYILYRHAGVFGNIKLQFIPFPVQMYTMLNCFIILYTFFPFIFITSSIKPIFFYAHMLFFHCTV